MSVLAELFGFVNRKDLKLKDKYIFYKIVDSFADDQFILQCINTKATLLTSLNELANDSTLLDSLHPIQSCFVGIEYAKALKNNALKNSSQTKKPSLLQTCRYGKYCLCYQDREGNIAFIDLKSKQEYLMDPRDISLTQELIGEFDASQAFYIGVCAGLKLENRVRPTSTQKYPHLKLIK